MHCCRELCLLSISKYLGILVLCSHTRPLYSGTFLELHKPSHAGSLRKLAVADSVPSLSRVSEFWKDKRALELISKLVASGGKVGGGVALNIPKAL